MPEVQKRDTRRLNPRHQDMVRHKIQASQIINRLQKCVDGDVEMTSVQVRAAGILLDRSVPTLTRTIIQGDGDNGVLQLTINMSDGKRAK